MSKRLVFIIFIVVALPVVLFFFLSEKPSEEDVAVYASVPEKEVPDEVVDKVIEPLDLSFERFELLAKKGENWLEVDDGLYVGKFKAGKRSDIGDSVITVIKINPEKYELKLLSAAKKKHPAIPADKWAEEYGLILVTNAGMFHTDFSTHVGYMRNFDYANNDEIDRRYHSIATFNPKEGHDRKFYIYDTEDTNIEALNRKYNSIVQNLRLIKRPGENRWKPQRKKWSEAALGQDRDGNILFIFSRYPYTMHDFNNILISLPINIAAAQHLEGGPEASLYFSHKNATMEMIGSYETDFQENDDNNHFWDLPNILGVVRR
jgi:hypothetical protein